MEMTFHVVYPHFGAFPSHANAQKWVNFFPFRGKKCDICFLNEWKMFSTPPARQLPKLGQFTGNSHGLCVSRFGTAIAKECIQIDLPLVPFSEIMALDVQTTAISRNPWSLRNAHFAWGSAFIGVLVAAVYFRVIADLVTTWWRDPDYSHGFLVPVFAAYLIWDKRESFLNKRVALAWSGVAVVALGLVVLLLGVYGASVFLARVSLGVVLAGLTLCLGGWQLLKDLRFALLVLFLAILLPAIIFNEIALPLQFFASKLASHLLPLFGVPVLREGNIIELATMKLEVAEACSGIRSLVTLFTLAVFYGYFLEKSFWRRVVLALSSIPIAIAANAIRIFGTGLCVEYWDPDKALGFFHEFSGWVMFVVSLGCLFIVHHLMRFLLARRRRA